MCIGFYNLTALCIATGRQMHIVLSLGASERKNDPSLAPEKIMELRFLNQKEHVQESDYFPPFDLLFDVEC